MVLPIIGVALPEGTGAPEVAALLEACDRAFLEGECQEAAVGANDPPTELTANIEWLSPTEARVSIARGTDAASDSEEVSFVEQDEVVERYRALGFAIGSLGSAFVADVEPPSETPPPKVTAPEPEPARAADPPNPIPAQPEPAVPLDPALTRFQLELGLLAGSGVERPRFGGDLSLWVPVIGRWTSRWAGNVAKQERTTEGIDASFFAASLGLGPRFMVGDSVLAVVVGVQLEQLRLSLGEAELTRGTPAVGPFIVAHGRLLASRFAPFLSLGAAALPATPIVLQDLDSTGRPSNETVLATHGPLQLDLVAGVSLAF